MDCSDGAKMLIDQMKAHPEEFRGFAGKFTSMLDTAREAMQGPHRNVKISQRDARAVMAAAETHLYEVWLAEDVLNSIMRPKEAEQEPKYKVGRTAPHVTNTAISNTLVPSYEEYMRRQRLEEEKYKMEEFRRRELEYGMRNTKPFKLFL
jgi:hypothetical protein